MTEIFSLKIKSPAHQSTKFVVKNYLHGKYRKFICMENIESLFARNILKVYSHGINSKFILVEQIGSSLNPQSLKHEIAQN